MKIIPMVKLLTLVALLLSVSAAYSQINLQWQIELNDASGNFIDKASDLELDAAGNTYVTGTSFNGTSYDIMTVKYDAAGVEQWRTGFDGPGSGLDEGFALTRDSNDDIFVTGHVFVAGSDWDIVVIKLNGLTGAIMWSDVLAGTVNFDSGRDIGVDNSDRVLVCGNYSTTPTNVQIITMQYPNAGSAPTWTMFEGAALNDEARALVIDAADNVYVAGHSEFSSATTYFDFRVIKYNSAGALQFSNTQDSGSDNLDTPHAIALDPASGDVVLGGQGFTDVVNEEDYLLIKFDGTTGAFDWLQQYAGDAEALDKITAIDIDAAGNIYVTGQSKSVASSEDFYTVAYNSAGVEQWNHRYTSPSLEFDSGSDIQLAASGLFAYVTGYSYEAGTNNDYTTLKYDVSSGNLEWSIKFDGPASLSDQAVKLQVDPTENIFVTGNSHGGAAVNLDYRTIKYCQLTTVASNDTAICLGQSVALTATGGSSPTWAVLSGDFGSLSCTSCGTTTATPTVSSVYTVSTTSASGCIDYDTVSVDVNPIPTPTIYNDTPLDFCIGDSVQLYTDTYASYVWSPGGSVDSFQVCFTPGLYTVTITDTNGCVNSANATVTNFPLPLVDAGPDDDLCIGDTYPMNATGAVDYLWAVDPTLSVLNIPNPDATPTVSTEYYVTGTDASGCSNTDTIFLTVNPLPPVNAGADESVCLTDSVQLNATGAISYSWLPNPTLSDLGIADPWATPTTLTEYFVTGTDANGCMATDSVIVSTIGLPTIEILGDVDTSVCDGESVVLVATGGLSGMYVWNADPSLSSTTADAPTATPTATTIYTVEGTDINGCSNTDDITVTLNPLPPVNAGLDASFCVGDSIQLNATGAVTYLWTFSASLSEINIPDPWATPASSPTTYFVTGTDANGCENTDDVTISIDPLPTITVSGDTTICNGDSTQITAAGGSTYLWAVDFSLSSITIGDPYASPTADNWYFVTGTDVNGCQGQDSIFITVFPTPIPPVLTKDSVWIISSYVTGNQWFNDVSGLLAGQTNDSLNYYEVGENGLYWVEFTDPNGCVVISDTITDPCIITDVGVRELEAFEVNVYPNPFNSVVYFDLERDLDELVVLAADGQLVMRRSDLVKGKNEIDFSELPSGMYLIQMFSEKQVVTKRLIKQ
jgi:hypothetical protein